MTRCPSRCRFSQDQPMYEHTQHGPWHWLLWAIAVGMLTAAVVSDEPAAQIGMACGTAIFVVVAISFRHLTVRDEGDRLLVAFGPLPLFRRSVVYDQIASVEQSQSMWVEGWGIHMSPRRMDVEPMGV